MSFRDKSDDGDQDKSNNNWFRSIPRRIRKLVSSKQSRLSGRGQRSMGLGGSHSSHSDSLDPNDPKRSNFHVSLMGQSDGDLEADDANLYLMVDCLGNDEEIAMIRACSQMSRYGWYWGPLSRHAAQRRLHATPNGSFLVRNSQINRNNFTVSFRTAGNTLHYRIEFAEGFWQIESSKYRSIVDLIEDAIKKSKDNVFCYVKPTSQLQPPFPVRLTNPISHFGDISTLQNMCRLVIQKQVDNTKMDLLPLPTKLITYCKEWGSIYGDLSNGEAAAR